MAADVDVDVDADAAGEAVEVTTGCKSATVLTANGKADPVVVELADDDVVVMVAAATELVVSTDAVTGKCNDGTCVDCMGRS